MKSNFFKYITVIILFFLPMFLNAQTDTLSILGGNKTDKEKDRQDTLNTHVFGIWHKKTVTFAWDVDPYFNTIERVPINDTLPNDVRVEYPFFKTDVGAVFLGTAGSAAMQYDFFKQERNEYFAFFEPYQSYAFNPENIMFFNTKRPFSVISYQLSGGKLNEESNIRLIHTQNVHPNLNVGFIYQRYGTNGQYQNQATDNKALVVFTNYTGKRYVAHVSYSFNNISNNENGGIANDRDITDTVIDSEEINVRLMKAHNIVKKHTFFFTQSIGIPIDFLNKKNKLTVNETPIESNIQNDVKPHADTVLANVLGKNQKIMPSTKNTDKTQRDFLKGTLIYFGNSIEYTKYMRLYTDMHDKNEDYYKNWYYNPIFSHDSTRSSYLDAKVFTKIQPWAADAILSTIAGGLGYQNQKFYEFNPNQYLSGTNTSNINSTYFYAKAEGKLSKYFEWNAFTKYFISGRENFIFDGKMKISVYPNKGGVHLNGRILLEYFEPNFYMENYYSNHVKWKNNFSKTTKTQIEGSLYIPDWNLEFGAKQALIKNYVYLDTTATPKQCPNNLSITSLFLRKNIKLGILHLDNELLMQISGNNDVLPLPKLSAHLTWYIQATLVKNVLVGQIGLDTRYNNKYYMYAYNPASGMFHTQKEKKIGNFPYVDAFANFKWKRTTIFIKLSNVAKKSFNAEYFSALHYPRNNAILLRLGITWHFFN